MGVGCYGITDTELEGVDYSSNWWFWRPLWDYVCASCDDIITTEEHRRGHYNCGDLWDREKNLRVAKRLRELIEQADHDKYAEHYDEKIKVEGKTFDYPFSARCVEEFTDFLEKADGLAIW